MRTVVLSGIQPTGIPHLGNYLGALREWRRLGPPAHPTTRHLFSVMDLHALTIPSNAGRGLHRDVIAAGATMLACGLRSDAAKNQAIFVQSHVPEHCELMWLLSCVTPLGLLERQVQFKDKSQQHGASSGLGLLSYPVLMAADVLLYKTTHVPVGHDQVQHLELARDLALAFKRAWGYSFPLPQAVLGESHRVMSLTDPEKKMSKSHPEEHSRILVTDTADQIRKKVQRAKTDSLGAVTLGDPQRVELNNLLSIYSALVPGGEKQAQGKMMGEFKGMLTDALVGELVPLGREISRYVSDPQHVEKEFAMGRDMASALAKATMKEVRSALGLS